MYNVDSVLFVICDCVVYLSIQLLRCKLQVYFIKLSYLLTQAQLKEMYAQLVYKDHKIIELNSRATDQDQVIIGIRELVSEKDEVIRGRDMAIQLLRSTIAQQSMKLHDQESLIARLSAKAEAAEIELNAFHERLESDADAGGEDQKLFASQLKAIQENFAELLAKKETEIVELRQQLADHEETLAEATANMNAGIDSCSPLAQSGLHHNEVGVSPVAGNDLQANSRIQELAAEVERLRDSLRNKDRMLASSDEQLLSVHTELQQLRSAVASSSDSSVYTTGSEMSVELPETRVPYEEGSCLRKRDADIPMMENEKQVDRRVCVMRPRQTCVLEITAEELQRNAALEEDETFVKSRERMEESQLMEAQNEELLSSHSLVVAREAELERLQKEICDMRNELDMKEKRCLELTAAFASLNEAGTVLRQQLVESELLCEESRRELTEIRDGSGANDAALELSLIHI